MARRGDGITLRGRTWRLDYSSRAEGRLLHTIAKEENPWA